MTAGVASVVTPVIACRGLSHAYPSGTRALADFSLTIGRGEFLSLLGPSGCGKSTFLRIAAGLIEPSNGRVARDPAIAASGRIGFVFQEPTLMPWATVRDNVALPLRLLNRLDGEGRRAVDAAMEQVGLADFAGAFPRELSGGMRMRASLARALVSSPDLLLLDEPFAALDEITRFRLNDDLLRLWRARRFTAVFVTHSVFESVFLSTRLAVMTSRPGRVHASLEVDLPQPRTATLRTESGYNELCRQVSALLEEASAA